MLKPPLIYAEYLRNIHSITVQVEFPISLSSTEPCSVEIRENGRVFAVCNGGREYALRLPATTVAKGPLLQPAVGQSGVSYRLPVAVAPSSDHRDGLQRSSLSASPDNFLPWCAPDLNSHEVIIHCRQCLSEIVPLGAVKKWKDLPSHNWAEMMDFWHCHKPHPTQGSSEPTCSHAGGEKWRGSGSVGNINGFTAQRQVGLVGIMALILARQDCVGVVVEKTAEKKKRVQNIICASCGLILGVGEERVEVEGADEGDGETWRFDKWNLQIQIDGHIQHFPAECFLSAQLLSMIDDQAIRRFNLTPIDNLESTGYLKVWVFNTDTIYSSTASSTVTRGIKVFYQKIPPNVGISESEAKDFEELPLSLNLYKEISEVLGLSNTKLPGLTSNMKEWKIGSLRRFAGPTSNSS